MIAAVTTRIYTITAPKGLVRFDLLQAREDCAPRADIVYLVEEFTVSRPFLRFWRRSVEMETYRVMVNATQEYYHSMARIRLDSMCARLTSEAPPAVAAEFSIAPR